jgi:hypothetical protein
MPLKWIEKYPQTDCSYGPRIMLTLMCRGTSSVELKDNTVIVVLGASGDLAKKKTVR